MSGWPGSAPVLDWRGTLEAVAPHIRCPVCAGPVAVGDDQVTCGRGHSFNIARQGYVSLTTGRGGPGTGDSAAMVLARDRFLGGGHYWPVAGALSALAAECLATRGRATQGRATQGRATQGRATQGRATQGRATQGRATQGRATRGLAIQGLATPADPDGPGLVLDLAGGTGYYLALVLDALDARLGACVDLSAPALRRAARAHPRAAALGADAWGHLPLADESAVLVLSVFGPRNPAEIRRVLAPGGTLIVATPGPDHHAELRRSLGLIGIDERKSTRLAEAYGDYASTAVTTVRYQLRLGHADLTDLVAMGPSARHIGADELAARVAALPPAPVTVTVDVEVRSYQG